MASKRALGRPTQPMAPPDPSLVPPQQYIAAPIDHASEPFFQDSSSISPAIPQSPPEEDEAAQSEPVELSDEDHVMFASLLTCGRKTKTVEIFSHIVMVQSLCGDDDLRIGLYAKEYEGSLGAQRAYQIGVAAAGIRSIDGTPLVSSLFADADEATLFDEKVKRVAKMYPVVIHKIYRAVLDAEKEFVELTVKLGKSDG